MKLLLFGKEKRYLNVLLSLGIFGVIWYCFIYLLTNSGLIREYPIFFNKGLPLYYLIAPCFFLYIRGSLYTTHAHFRFRHLWHLIIIVPALVSIAPYNLADSPVQQWVVDHIESDVSFAFSDNRYIVPRWHWFTFPLSALIYTMVQLRLTVQSIKSRQHEKKTMTWVLAFTLICGSIFLGMMVVNVNVLANLQNTWQILQSGKIVLFLSLIFLVLSGSFYLSPTFVFGFIQAKSMDLKTKSARSARLIKPGEFSETRIKIYDHTLIAKVEEYLIRAQAFKKAGLTVSDVASILEIPNHKLSDLFNNHYRLNFNTYINNLRVLYIKERLDAGEWKQFTLEAIAHEAGFSSRNTFLLAFKKTMGITPSNYLTALKEKAA